MRLFPWIIREIRFRSGISMLILAIPLSAAFLWTLTGGILDLYDKDASIMFSQKEKALEKQMAHMWDEYRKMTKDLGFNVLILPEDQNLADFYSEQFASEYMPEYYADTLASSATVTIQHILPALFHRTYWPEQKRSVLVCGVRGEVPRALFPAANKKSPILQPVEDGTVVCGYELGKSMNLNPGKKIKIHGETFTVAKCHERRGNQDDITVWMPLGAAQKMFGKGGKINAILALECRCTADESLPNLAKIRKSLASILPQTQVLEFMSEVITRAEARFAAVELKKEALDKERAEISARQEQREKFAGLILSLLSVAALFFIGFLVMLNVRSRIYELGIFRAIGFAGKDLFTLLLGKVLLLGMAGSALGVISGRLIYAAAGSYMFDNIGSAPFEKIPALLIIILMGGVLTTLSGLYPVMVGLRQQPAEILRRAS